MSIGLPFILLFGLLTWAGYRFGWAPWLILSTAVLFGVALGGTAVGSEGYGAVTGGIDSVVAGAASAFSAMIR